MKKSCIILFVLSVLLFNGNGFSQTTSLQKDIINIYPKNHSVFVNTKSPLIFNVSKTFLNSGLQNVNFRVTGTKSGTHETTRKIARNGKTLLIKPDTPFMPAETVLVEVIKNTKPENILISYSFSTRPNTQPLLSSKEMLHNSLGNAQYSAEQTCQSRESLQGDPNLPEDFPKYYVSEKNNPGVGHYFVNALSRDTAKAEYNLIIDTTGFPVFYQHFPPHHRENFFTYHPTVELLTYYDESIYKFVALNNNLEKVGTYEAIGYFTDLHELILDEDGSYWLFGYDTEPVDMSQIYPGGCSSALVTGTIIQKIDADSNLVFEWSSWDHFSILDADTGIVDLTKCQFDYCHGNALSFDSVGNVLLSSRNMSEITKIDVQTGDIIWRMGGYHNQFTFTNDTIPFKGQHNIKYLGSSLYSMFDNGNSRMPPFTRAITYQLDETNMTATLVEDFQQNDPPDFTPFMGSNQKLENGSHLIGWAFNLEKYAITQFDINGNIEFEIKPVDTFSLISYRATKYVWETSLFNFNTDTLNLGTNILIGDSAFTQACLVNQSDNPIEINGYYCTDSTFTLATPLPFTLEGNSCDTITIHFKPVNTTPVSAVFSIYHQTDSIRIACQTRVLGGGIIDNIFTNKQPDKKLLIAPNPCSTQCNISFNDGSAINRLKVFSLEGKLIKDITVNNKRSITLSKMQQGAWLVKLFGKKSFATGKLIVR